MRENEGLWLTSFTSLTSFSAVIPDTESARAKTGSEQLGEDEVEPLASILRSLAACARETRANVQHTIAGRISSNSH